MERRGAFDQSRFDHFLKQQTKENISQLRSEIPTLFESFFSNPAQTRISIRYKPELEWKEQLGKLAAAYPEITLSEIGNSIIERRIEPKSDPKYTLTFHLFQYEMDDQFEEQYKTDWGDYIEFSFQEKHSSITTRATNQFYEQNDYYQPGNTPQEEEFVLLTLRDSLVFLRDERSYRREMWKNPRS